MKISIMLIGSSLFVAGGVWILPDNPIIGWLTIIFFGACALVFLVLMHPKSSLLALTEEGFTVTSLFRPSFTPWSSVQSFKTYSFGHTKMVGWDYSPGFDKPTKLRRLNTKISGVEAALPDTFGKKAEELTELMNEIRWHYG